MKKIGIVGTRKRNTEDDFKLCEREFLRIYEDGDELVSGGCYLGADKFCEIIAKKFTIPIKIYYANWNKYGKSAGFKRNTNIAEDSDVIIALLPKDAHSYGTEDTIKKAEKMGKSIILVPEPTKDFDPYSI